MPVVTPITIPPFAPSSSSAAGVLREWERGAGRALEEADRGDVALATARRGAVELTNDARSIEAKSGEVVRGVAAANPGAEGALASKAAGNRAGVSKTISDAERNANDPTAPTPRPNMGAAEANVAGPAGGIRAGANQIGSKAGQGDDLERRI